MVEFDHFFYEVMDVLDWIIKAEEYDTKIFLEGFALDIVSDEKAVDIQRDQWEQEGHDYQGRIIGFYSPLTEILTSGRKKAGDKWTLNDTGDFYEQTYLKAPVKGKDLEFIFDSNGINKLNLFRAIRKEWTGSYTPTDIFGLQNKSQQNFIIIIEPKFIKQLENYYDV